MEEYIVLGDLDWQIKNASKDYLKLSKLSKNRKVDIEHLRHLYKYDKSIFFNLTNEILLRGGYFQVNKDQNILKNIAFKNEFIFKDKDEFKTKKINFEEYDLGDFIKRYNIENDKFFNYIFIDAFKAINKNIDTEALKNEFIELGFEIFSTNTFSPKYINRKNIDKTNKKYNKIVDKKNKKYNTIDVDILNYDSIINELDNIFISIPENILSKNIKEVFSESFEYMFVDYCIKNNIELINELNGLCLYNFSKCKGIGEKKFNLIKQKLESYRDYEQKFISLNLLDKKIAEVFTQEIFLDYCINNNKIFLKDILEEIENGFLEIPKFGPMKSKILFSQLNDLIKNTKSDNIALKNFIIKLNEHFFEKIKFKKINDIANILKINLDSNNITEKCFKEIQDTNINNYSIDNHSKKQIMEMIDKINNLSNIDNLLNNYLKNLKKDDRKILEKRYLLNNTLEEIGNDYNVTRERIRQRISQSIRKLNKLFIINDIINSLKLEFIDYRFVEFDEIFNIINPENILGFKIFLESKENHIFRDMDILLLSDNKDLKDYINQSLEKIASYLGDEFIIDDVIDELKNMYEKIGFKNLENYKIEQFIIKLGYKKYGKFYSKNTFSLQKGYELIIEKYIPGSLIMNDIGITLLKDFYFNIFERNISNKNIKNIEAKILENSNMICIAKNEYIHVKNWSISSETIQVVDTILENMLISDKITTVRNAIKYYKNELLNVGIDNKYYFYSIVKYFFNDKYTTGKWNTMSVAYKENKDIITATAENIFKNYIIENTGIVLKSKVLNDLMWSYSKLETTISKSDEIIRIGDFIVLMSHKLLSENIKSKFKTIVNESLNKNNVVTTEFVYSKALMDTDLYTFLQKFHIKSKKDIVSIIKKLNPELKGHTNLLYSSNSRIRSPEDIILNEFKYVHKKIDIFNRLEEIGYKEAMIRNIFSKLLLEKKYYLISNIEVAYKDKIAEIEKVALDAVYKLLDSEITQKDYLILNNISGLRRKLPRIDDITWEPELISSLVDGRRYKRIKRIHHDYTGTDKIILVKDTSPIKSFDELIKHIILNEYTDTKHKSCLYNFLVKQGVLYNNKRKEVLPFEILNSDLFEFNEMGGFKIKE